MVVVCGGGDAGHCGQNFRVEGGCDDTFFARSPEVFYSEMDEFMIGPIFAGSGVEPPRAADILSVSVTHPHKHNFCPSLTALFTVGTRVIRTLID